MILKALEKVTFGMDLTFPNSSNFGKNLFSWRFLQKRKEKIDFTAVQSVKKNIYPDGI